MWDEPQTGRRHRWQPQEIEYLEQKLLKEQRTYNSHQLCEHLKKYQQVVLGGARIREILIHPEIPVETDKTGRADWRHPGD